MLRTGDGGVSLRPFGVGDVKRALRWRNREDIRLWFVSRETISARNHCRWARRHFDDPTDLLWVIQLDGVPVGQAGLIVMSAGEGEFGRFYIGEQDVRGRGVAREALRLVTEFAGDELCLQRLYLTVMPTNSRALDLYYRSGWRRDILAGGAKGGLILLVRDLASS
jgi:RimJ/RimL family protein N-acetyltransferase